MGQPGFGAQVPHNLSIVTGYGPRSLLQTTQISIIIGHFENR
jgi:hypothetical protein